jgi:hypothetical protein
MHSFFLVATFNSHNTLTFRFSVKLWLRRLPSAGFGRLRLR